MVNHRWLVRLHSRKVGEAGETLIYGKAMKVCPTAAMRNQSMKDGWFSVLLWRLMLRMGLHRHP
jgi:hypothetical protein